MNSNRVHLTSALLAIMIALGTLAYGTIYAQSMEQKYIHALTSLRLSQSNIGSALQQAAFQQSDLLMIYGSSEMVIEDTTTVMTYGGSKVKIDGTPYGASQFFQYYPTGFNIYEIAEGGTSSLNIAQALAAIGPQLRGKKVVISFTPTIYHKEAVSSSAYAGNFSLLHANALIFNPYLSIKTKQIAARRMIEYPETLNKDPVLKYAVRYLGCGCRYRSYLYLIAWPLGMVDTWVIQLQDHWEVLDYIWKHPNLSSQVIRKPEQIDWSTQIAQATMTQAVHSSNNPYGIENSICDAYYSKIMTVPQKPASADYSFLKKLNDSQEWTDFDLVLRVLKEAGAQPLILSRPLDGPIWNFRGLSKWARKQYHVKLQNAVSPYGFPVISFVNHEGDRYFSIDQWSHTSREGWVYIDMSLDEFFHRQIH
ncbi:MAG TPA: D-alanyl-lipoteichoic acid biosynthesis protein DltD [Anaerolineales bacterium]